MVQSDEKIDNCGATMIFCSCRTGTCMYDALSEGIASTQEYKARIQWMGP